MGPHAAPPASQHTPMAKAALRRLLASSAVHSFSRWGAAAAMMLTLAGPSAFTQSEKMALRSAFMWSVLPLPPYLSSSGMSCSNVGRNVGPDLSAPHSAGSSSATPSSSTSSVLLFEPEPPSSSSSSSSSSSESPSSWHNASPLSTSATLSVILGSHSATAAPPTALMASAHPVSAELTVSASSS
eukprot:1762021-Pyramimonas_sp.AAC.2